VTDVNYVSSEVSRYLLMDFLNAKYSSKLKKSLLLKSSEMLFFSSLERLLCGLTRNFLRFLLKKEEK
jgi:hypothetical protein